MPRPKGSKNKKSIAAAPVIENIDQISEKIATVEAEIAAIGEL